MERSGGGSGAVEVAEGTGVAAPSESTPVGHRRRAGAGSGAVAAGAMSKVPEVTALFWVTKVLTTGMGETTSDYLARVLGPVGAGAIGLFGLVGLLMLQFRSSRYSAWTYWSAIVMVSVFGTMAADVVHVVAGVPYAVSATAFAVILAAVLVAWYRSEGTLSIHSIRTRRREKFYWATVLATFALGTAVGDLTAGGLHLGYFSSGVMFAALIAVPAIGGIGMGLNAVAAFWAAYVLTRPLGASFADWMGGLPPPRRARLGHRAGQPRADRHDRGARGVARGPPEGRTRRRRRGVARSVTCGRATRDPPGPRPVTDRSRPGWVASGGILRAGTPASAPGVTAGRIICLQDCRRKRLFVAKVSLR